MRFVIQRVKEASVTVYEEDAAGKILPDGKVTGSIGKGFMVLVGACQSDTREIADKMIRNEIMSPNEMRQKLGMKPSDNPKADELRNPNISEPAPQAMEEYEMYEEPMAQAAIIPVGGCGKPVGDNARTESPLPRFSREPVVPVRKKKKKSGTPSPRGPTG